MRTCSLSLPLIVLIAASLHVGAADDSPPKTDAWRSVVYVFRQPESGLCQLKADEHLLRQIEAKPRDFQLRRLWRYEPTTQKWEKVKYEPAKSAVIKPVDRKIYSSKTDPTLVSLPETVGLFWLEWIEDGHKVNEMAVSGPVLCNDLPLTEPPEGTIWACVPFKDRGWATSVPDPKIHCRE